MAAGPRARFLADDNVMRRQDRADGHSQIAPDASPMAVAETLRSFIRENRSSRPALKGIADVHVTDGSVLASMHAGSEPQLVELSPGNEAACHLVTQSLPTDATITA